MFRLSISLLVFLSLAGAIPSSGQSTIDTTAAAPARAAPADRWLGPDKPVHALAAYLAAGSGYAAGIELGWEPSERRGAAIAAAVGASFAKEAFDAAVQGERWSWKDLGADAVGALLFVALTLAADR